MVRNHSNSQHIPAEFWREMRDAAWKVADGFSAEFHDAIEAGHLERATAVATVSRGFHRFGKELNKLSAPEPMIPPDDGGCRCEAMTPPDGRSDDGAGFRWVRRSSEGSME